MVQPLRTSPLLVCLALSACFTECLDPGNGGTGGGSGGGGDVPSVSLSYDLIEATGEFTLTGKSTSATCVSTTTASGFTLSLPAKYENAATYHSSIGTFFGFGAPTLATRARTGMTVCTGSQRVCPTSPDTAMQRMAFLSVGVAGPSGTTLPRDAPDGLAFVPQVTGLALPQLCDGTGFAALPIYDRGRPISVAQLKSGRFVIEASGTLPITTESAESTPVEGTLTYTFRLVFQTADYDPSKAVEPPVLASFDECLAEPVTTEDDLERAQAVAADGGTLLPLDAKGCRRIEVSRTGATTTVTHLLTRGTKLVYDPTTGTSRGERDDATLYAVTQDATGEHERFDSNGDGFVEETTDTVFSGTVWQSTAAKWFAAGQTAPIRTTTLTRIDDATMQVRTEIGGTVEEDYVARQRQSACFNSSSMTDPACAGSGGPGPTCGGATAPCTAAQKRTINKQLADALKKGSDCMQKAGYDGFQPAGKGLTMIATNRLNLLCSTDPCDDYGYFGRAQNPDGKHDFMVNVVRAAGAELAKTLFHEMLHSDPSFNHDDKLVSLASKACKLQLVDRTYACETMCFAPARGGSCACERCLNPSARTPKKEICDKCSSFGACPGRQGVRANGLVGNISQGIGAYCERNGEFCDTKAECDTACTFGSCTPIKTVCDDMCN